MIPPLNGVVLLLCCHRLEISLIPKILDFKTYMFLLSYYGCPIGERRRCIILKMEKQIKELIDSQETKSYNLRDS
jgi:hypothetical protein